MVGSISNLIKGTLALRYDEQDTIQPIILISMATWASSSLTSSLVWQGMLYTLMSMSEVGKDRPTALEPKSITSEDGNSVFIKKRTLSKLMALLSYSPFV